MGILVPQHALDVLHREMPFTEKHRPRDDLTLVRHRKVVIPYVATKAREQ